MLNNILIDSGPLIALFDKDDFYHNKIIRFLHGSKYKFITTIAVLTEVTHMLDFNVNAQLSFLNWVQREGVLLHNIRQSDIGQIIKLTVKYNDLPMDFADATLVLAAENERISKIISFDSDFNIYRLSGKKIITNVFAEYLK